MNTDWMVSTCHEFWLASCSQAWRSLAELFCVLVIITPMFSWRYDFWEHYLTITTKTTNNESRHQNSLLPSNIQNRTQAMKITLLLHKTFLWMVSQANFKIDIKRFQKKNHILCVWLAVTNNYKAWFVGPKCTHINLFYDSAEIFLSLINKGNLGTWMTLCFTL